MRRLVLVVLASSWLAGCGSVSIPGLGLSSGAAPPVAIQLESNPSGASAQTSTGQTCVTPCSLSVPAEPMSVTFSLDRHEPQTISLQPTQKQVTDYEPESSGVAYVWTLEPSPVFADLAPTAPPRQKRRPAKKPAKRAAAPPAEAPATAPAAAPSASPFPDPQAPASPFPTR